MMGKFESEFESGFGGVVGAGPGGSSKVICVCGFACNVRNTISGFHGCIPVCLKADIIVVGLNACLRMYSNAEKNFITENNVVPILIALSIA